MKFFIGFITSTVIIVLILTGLYAYKELKPNDNDNVQSNEQNNQSNETPTQQETNNQGEQTAPATAIIPAHEEDNTEKQDMKQDMSDTQYIQHQYDGLKQHMKERASQGADADELHKLQSQLDDYATQHADELNFDK